MPGCLSSACLPALFFPVFSMGFHVFTRLSFEILSCIIMYFSLFKGISTHLALASRNERLNSNPRICEKCCAECVIRFWLFCTETKGFLSPLVLVRGALPISKIQKARGLAGPIKTNFLLYSPKDYSCRNCLLLEATVLVFLLGQLL